MFKKPLIGLTLDLENTKSYSVFPWYAIRKNYCSSITKFGGIPIPLTYDSKSVKEILSIIDGIIVTGGGFDIDPRYFKQRKIYSNVVTKEERTKFEIILCKNAIKNNIPVLGICGGEQLLNVVYGGSLVQDIKMDLRTSINHEQTNPRDQTSHGVNIIQNTKLEKIIKQKTIKVNSAHHQAVKEVGKGLTINALAEDGVIEGIEDKNKDFCMGIQWHPEFLIEKSDIKIFQSFLLAARKYRRKTK